VTSWLETPTRNDVADALQKGFGRAYLWAKRGQIDGDILLEACLNDYRFDRQVEDTRGDWLWQLIVAGTHAKRLQEPLLVALKANEVSNAQFQLCQLALHFAREGDSRFRLELQRVVENTPSDDESRLGEEELIRLNGEKWFLTAVTRHGAEMTSREWDWFDGGLVDKGIKWLGEGHVSQLLNAEATINVDASRFREAWVSYSRRLTLVPCGPR
jgi:hypothetical protein